MYNFGVKRAYIFLYSFLLFTYFLITLFSPITAINQDLGEQILQGRIINETKSVPHTNMLSYTYPNFPFIETYWLTSFTFFQITQIGGFDLLILFNTLLVGFAFGLLAFYSYKRHSLLSVLIATTIYLSIYRIRGDVRPETLSLFFVSIFVFTLLSFKKKMSKKIFILIPLEILWVNFHIYYLFGPVIVFLFFIDAVIEENKIRFFSDYKKIRHFGRSKEYFYLLIGTIAATLINPYGIKGAISPLIILPKYGISVTENQSVVTLIRSYFFTKSVFDPLLLVIVIILLFATLIIGKKNTKPIDWFMSIIFSLSAIFVFRNVALFVLATFTIFTSQLDFIFKKYGPKIKEYIPGTYWFEASLSLVMICVIILHSIAIKGVGFGIKEDYKGALDFFQTSQFSGPIFNNYNIGGYLAYRIYPNRVYIDNRPEAYPVEFTSNIYSRMQSDPQIFKSEDEKYHFNSIVVSYWDNLYGVNKLLPYLVNNSEFVPVYLDAYAVVLIRNIPSNAATIQRYKVTKNSIDINSINNPVDLAHYLLFFREVGWSDQAKKTAEKLDSIEPKLNRLLEPY
jgi:hypothetical protein